MLFATSPDPVLEPISDHLIIYKSHSASNLEPVPLCFRTNANFVQSPQIS